MKKIFPILMSLILLVSCGNIPVQKVQTFIDETKAEVCPDRRVNIFDLEYTQNGKVVTLEGEMNSSKGLKSMVAALEEEGYTVANKVRLLPDKELQGKTYGVVSRSVSNMRVEPSARSEMATQAVLGTPLRVYKRHANGDYYVQTPDGYLGWMESSAFTAMTPSEFKHWRKSEKVIYLADAGYVYSKASTKSQIVSDITAKSLLLEVGRYGDFTLVVFPDGRKGYIETAKCENFYVFLGNAKPTTPGVLKLAHSYMGRPYLWGGTSTKMMDCSGFVRTVMFMQGIYLPRDASQQVFVGKTVAEGKEEIDKLKAGDILFFGMYREDGSERITHVGIYIGDGKFIHEDGDVNILSFNPEDKNYSKYRHDLFIRAKDVIHHVGKYGVKHIKDVPLFL
ncbi:MAG: C40 family peptidase [Candidatus Marinimicrobia bacterium]|nr:C40 family peptidase [Candidatus Neomarinimicrobiota bacterium]